MCIFINTYKCMSLTNYVMVSYLPISNASAVFLESESISIHPLI